MIITLHLVALFFTVCLILYADEQALMWFLGKKSILDKKVVHWLHTGVAIGLGLMILTGAFLLFEAPVAYLSYSVFLVKMVAVAALIINTGFISHFSHVAINNTFVSLTPKQRTPLFISGGVSVAGWLTAIICGLML